MFKIEICGEEQDEEFETYEEAEEYAVYLRGCARQGAEILFMSNPGDNPYDEDTFESPEYSIIEYDDED